MRAAAYCRVSTEKEDQINSLEAQKEFFVQYTKRTGDTLVKIYADEGISGTKIKNRKQFLQMMEDAKENRFEMILVKDISRFARNTVDLLQNIRTLKAMGIETQFLTANMTSMGNSEFVLTIFAALAQEESANISKRVKFGKKINAAKGRVPNLVYGYDKIPGDYFHLQINEREAAVVKEIFELYLMEEMGAFKIAKYLNQKGIFTKRGCLWSQTAICRILSNEIYIGKIINGRQEIEDFLTGKRRKTDKERWIVINQPQLRLIDDNTFKKAQQIMEERKKAQKNLHERKSSRYLFSTLIKCKECGCSFKRMKHTYKNTYIRWVCSMRNEKGIDCCKNVTKIEEEELIGVLEQYFEKIILTKKDVMDQVIAKFLTQYEEKAKVADLPKQIESKIMFCEKKQEKYMNLYMENVIKKEELKMYIEQLRQEKTELEKKKDEYACLSKDVKKREIILREILKTPKDLINLHEMKQVRLKKIIQKIEVDANGNVDIYLVGEKCQII